MWQFAGNKPEMENAVIAYMEGRGDDVTPPPAPVAPAPVAPLPAKPKY